MSIYLSLWSITDIIVLIVIIFTWHTPVTASPLQHVVTRLHVCPWPLGLYSLYTPLYLPLPISPMIMSIGINGKPFNPPVSECNHWHEDII